MTEDRANISKSEKRYQSLFNNAADLMAVIDIKGNFLNLNKKFEEESGYKREEMLGKNLITCGIITKESSLKVIFHLGKLLKGEEAPIFEVDGIKKDGGIVNYELRSVPIIEKGKIVEVQAILRNITERKKAEEELKSSEERFKLIFEKAPDAYYISDLKGTFIDGNKMSETIIGYKKEELIGKNFLKTGILLPRDLPRAMMRVAANAVGRGTGPDEFTLKRKDDRFATVEITTYPVKMKGKTLVLGIARDIAERKNMQKDLIENERKLRLITESASDMISMTSLDGVYTYVSPSHKRILGYGPEDLLGKSGFDFFHPEDKKNIKEQAKEYTEDKLKWIFSGGEGNVRQTLEYRFLNKKGEWRNIEATGNIVKSLTGPGFEVVFISRDVTERKGIEADLRNRTDALNRSNQELEEKIEELEGAMGHIKRLEGIVPICANCKKIRQEGGDEEGGPEKWVSLEQYIGQKTDANLSHGLCPECIKRLYGDTISKERN